MPRRGRGTRRRVVAIAAEIDRAVGTGSRGRPSCQAKSRNQPVELCVDGPVNPAGVPWRLGLRVDGTRVSGLALGVSADACNILLVKGLVTMGQATAGGASLGVEAACNG